MIEPSTWEQFLQFVNRGGFAWANLLGQDRVYPWTPTDASGANLTLTALDAWYMRVGRLCWVSATITYPVTADGTNSSIGGFPFLLPSFLASRTGTLSYHNGATAVYFLLSTSSRVGGFFSAAGAAVTNAQMSNTLSYINAVYPVA